MSSAERPDAIVVGAGIVGAACARALARAGMRVLILDAEFGAGGTTAAGMGHLVVMDDSAAQLGLTALSLDLWRREQLPAAAEMDPCGTIWVAEDDAQLDAVREKQRTYRDLGVDAEMIGPAELARLEPNLRPGLAGGLRVSGDRVVYPPGAARHLIHGALSSGAVLREHCTVDEILDEGVRIGSEVVESPVVVNAAGAGAAALTPSLDIVPRKGHLAITDRYPGFCGHQLVELGYLTSAHVMTSESVAFNVQPRVTGQVLIGSSRELAGWDASTNRRILADMLERAAAFMPAIASLNVVRTWTGFRPTTPHKLPLIGPCGDRRGLWIAAGHEGLGITTSLGTAAILADLILGRTPPMDAAPFAPRGRAA